MTKQAETHAIKQLIRSAYLALAELTGEQEAREFINDLLEGEDEITVEIARQKNECPECEGDERINDPEEGGCKCKAEDHGTYWGAP